MNKKREREKKIARKKQNLQVSVSVRLRVAATVCYIDDNLSTDMLMDDKRQEPTATRSLPKSLVGHDYIIIMYNNIYYTIAAIIIIIILFI